MAETTNSPAQTVYDKNLAANTATAFSGDPVVAKPEGQGFWGQVGDVWMQETWIGSAARYGLIKKDKDSLSYDYSPDFNPYKYYLDNKETLSKLQPHILNGLFDDVFSAEQFDDRAARLTQEMETRQRIANGSTSGAVVGGLLSFADISTFVPGINVAKKLNTTSTIGKVINSAPIRWAATGAYVSAVQEGGLQALQTLRTMDETEQNILFGAGLGGALGTVVSRGSALNPKSPDYLFNPNTKVVMGIKSIGQKVSESPAFEPVIRNGKQTWDAIGSMPMPGGGSLGAAAVKGVDRLKSTGEFIGGALKTPIQAVGRAGQAVVESTIARATPIGRGLTALSEKARTLTASLYDMGGVLLDGHKSGQYIKSFEDVAEGFKRNMDMLQVQVREVYIGMQLKLAELAGKETSAMRIAAGDVGSDIQALGRDIFQGPGASGRPRDTDFASRTGRLERFEFEDLIEHQMREDITPEITANLEGRFGKDGADMILNTAKRVGEAIHEHNLNIENKLVETGLLRDADRLGREYVAPQLWSGRGIRANKARAKEFFMRLFANDPSDEFLAANAITREQFNKLGKEPVTIGTDKSAVEYSIDAGLRHKNEILGDWAGALRDDKLAQLENRLKTAESDYEQNRRSLILAARELRKTETQIRNASVEEAEAIIKYRMEVREKSRVELELKRVERDKARAEAEQAKAEMVANNPEKALEEAIVKYAGSTGGQKSAVKQAEQMFELMVKDGDPNSIKIAKDDLVDADNQLWNAQKDAVDIAQARRDYVSRVEKKRVAAEARLQELSGKLDEMNREIVKLESRLNRIDASLEPAAKLLGDTKQAVQNIKLVRKLRNEAVSEMRKETGQSKRELKAAKRAMRKFKGETLEDHVDNLIDTLSQRHSGMAPIGVIESQFMESGRTRLRYIKMNNEQLREAKGLGLLRGDLFGRLESGNTEIGRQIAMREVFGHYGTTNDDIVKKIVKEVEDEYDNLILKAKNDGKLRLVRKLEKEQRLFIGESGKDGDIVKGFKRQFGRLDLPTDPESMMGWLTSKAREFNFIRYGSGFLISSLTDVANVAMTSGFGTFSYATARGLNRTISGMSNPEIRRMVQALELVMHNSRNFKINSMDDMRLMAGIGEYGTVKHYLTSSTDRLMNGMSQTTSYMSGMMWWNTRLKMAAMVEMQHNFVESAAKYDRLLKEASAGNKDAELQIARLASLGLGADQMRGVQAMLAKHAPENVDGLWELGMARWLKEGDVGQRAYEDVLTALEHVSSRAVMTPGRGDTPFLMSNTYFKMLLQFQTYGFTIINRYMLPGFQRMANYGDMDAFLTFGMSLMMGGVVVSAKDILNDGKIKERTPIKWGYDAIDRAGYLAFLSSYMSAGIRMAGGETSRYSQERNRMSQVLGPTGALIQDVWDVADGMAAGDMDRTKKAAIKLAPLNTYLKVIKLATGN